MTRQALRIISDWLFTLFGLGYIAVMVFSIMMASCDAPAWSKDAFLYTSSITVLVWPIAKLLEKVGNAPT